MSKCKTFLTLVVGLLFSLPAMAYSPPGNANTQHTTKIELKPASFLDMSRAYKTAAVCFLGVGDCDNEISYGKGGDGEDYTVDTAAQCKNEGFILNNCNSVQVPEGYCPYNKSYVTRCKCASNLVTCPAGQVGVGPSCNGRYASCKCDPALKTCSSKEVGQGASCGGKYQSCACKSEYATIPPTVRHRVRQPETAAAANIRSVPARRVCLRERTVVKNTIRRPATRSARRLMRTTAGTARRFQPRTAASRILRIVPASARRLIPTTAATVRQSRPTTAARPTGRTVQPNARLPKRQLR